MSKATIHIPEKMVWTQNSAGARGTLFRGEMNVEDKVFIFRVRWPAGFRSSPHLHSVERVVTVLSGIYYYGEGTEIDEKAAIACGPGSVIVVPPQTSHFGFTVAGVEFQEMSIPANK